MRLKRLKAIEVSRSNLRPGLYADGGGLYLRVAKGGSRQWIFRYRKDGRLTDIGLGGTAAVPLSVARDRAAVARLGISEGRDPLEQKRSKAASEKAAREAGKSFEQVARECVEVRRSGWRSPKHAAQWLSTLETYAFPSLGEKPVGEIDVKDIRGVLDPIWVSKTETASRTRQRIEAVLDYARVHGLRTGENPARWKGHLAEVLPARSKVQRVRHQPAMPYSALPKFVHDLRGQGGLAALALEFLILTATRSGEVTGAHWREIDLMGRVWTIPPDRIKAGREHRVPLSPRSVQILSSMPSREGFVFPGQKRGAGLSSGAFRALLERMEVADVVPHGFRSSFRDWAAEKTSHPREVAEAALAHAVSNKVEAAYRRSDLFDAREQLMKDWADYCEGVQSKPSKSQDGLGEWRADVNDED
jgi:integrase